MVIWISGTRSFGGPLFRLRGAANCLYGTASSPRTPHSTHGSPEPQDGISERWDCLLTAHFRTCAGVAGCAIEWTQDSSELIQIPAPSARTVWNTTQSFPGWRAQASFLDRDSQQLKHKGCSPRACLQVSYLFPGRNSGCVIFFSFSLPVLSYGICSGAKSSVCLWLSAFRDPDEMKQMPWNQVILRKSLGSRPWDAENQSSFG